MEAGRTYWHIPLQQSGICGGRRSAESHRESGNRFVQAIRSRSELLNETLRGLQSQYPQLNAQVRGKGLIYGFELVMPELSQAIRRAAFERGLIIERCGALDTVLGCCHW